MPGRGLHLCGRISLILLLFALWSAAAAPADRSAVDPFLPVAVLDTVPSVVRVADTSVLVGVGLLQPDAQPLAFRPTHDRLLASRVEELRAAAAPGPWDLDLAIDRRIRSEALQENRSACAVAGVLRFAAIPGTLILAGGLYGVGELSDRPNLSELGVHTGQAVVIAGATTLVGKVVLGRARPYEAPADASDFRVGRGLRGDRYQSFPSAHTAVVFAAAALLGSELSVRHPGNTLLINPMLYGAATLAGVSRIYHHEHWATDVAAGALIGTVAGRRTAAYHR
jgi:membrane-associated phospholipid phosphatase